MENYQKLEKIGEGLYTRSRPSHHCVQPHAKQC